MGKLSHRIFSLSLEEVTFARRGFRGADPATQRYLERVGATFLAGYHAALAHDEDQALVDELEAIDLSFRGFAYEGAGMSLAMLDQMMPWRPQRFVEFVAGPGSPHVYMMNVGAGWAMARLPFGKRRILDRLDPLLRWLAFDGLGFHEGYFHWPKSIDQQKMPRSVRGYECRCFDQGLGRSLWFVHGADVERVIETIGRFSVSRQSDLWAGVGLASTYAGGVPRESLLRLVEASGAHRLCLAQGSAFAAEARRRAGNLQPHTELATRVLCGSSAEEAAEVTSVTRRGLPADTDTPAFEIWRRRIQADLGNQVPMLAASA